MEADEVVAKVYKPTEWVHNPVIVEKNNGKLRMRLDPRELNKYLKREHFQLPTWKEIASPLAWAKYFSKFDANQGYWQITLGEESTRLATFNTPFGRYRFRRTPFGIHSAQEVSHKRISQHFEDHSIPKYPWQVIGTDIFHWKNDNFFLVVDYYSRYWEINSKVWRVQR